MQPEPQEFEKDFGKGMKGFALLIAKTTELERIKDQAEKATDRKSVDLQETIRDKTQ